MSAPDCEFDRLLLEGWERCADDAELRGSAAYRHARRLLAELTSRGARGRDELTRLGRAVRAMRARDFEGLRRQLDVRPERRERAAVAREERPRRPEQQPSSAGRALKAADAPRFLRDVAAHTRDRGALLARVTDAVLADFRTFADAALGARVARNGTALARELTAARARYGALARRAAGRALLTVALLRELMPAFDWNRYAAEPDYMRLVAVRPRPGCASRAADDDADDGGARGRRLLYELDWLRSEVDRTAAEGRCLREQHAALAAELAAVNRDVARERRDAAGRVARASRELDGLRARSAGQVRAVDRLVVAVQMAAVASGMAARDGAADVCANPAADNGRS